jgi:hypothetical protein
MVKLKKFIKLSILVVFLLWPLKTWAFNINLDCPDTITSTSFDCDIVFVPGTETMENLAGDLDLTNISDYTFVNTNPTDISVNSVGNGSFSLNFLNNITIQKEIGTFRFTISDPDKNVVVKISNILGNGNITAPEVTKAYNVEEPTPTITDATLSSLTFTGYTLNFVSTTENYTLNITGAKTLNFTYVATSTTATVAVTQDGNPVTSNSVTVNNNSTLKFTVTNGSTTKTYTVDVVINTSTNPKTGLNIYSYVIIMVILMIAGTYLITNRGNGIEKTK